MTEQAKAYYELPTDQYNQPDGTIIELSMTESEFQEYRKANPWAYLYDDYKSALYWAMD